MYLAGLYIWNLRVRQLFLVAQQVRHCVRSREFGTRCYGEFLGKQINGIINSIACTLSYNAELI